MVVPAMDDSRTVRYSTLATVQIGPLCVVHGAPLVRSRVMEPASAGNVKSRIDRVLTALHRNIAPGSFQAYLFAICCFVVAALAHLALGRLSDDIAPFVTFYPAPLVAALIGGLGPGVLATALGGLIVWWAFLLPQFSFYMSREGDVLSLLTYCAGSMLVVWVGDYFRSLSKRLEDEENFRKLALQELSHRLKNKLATIQATIAIPLRVHPQVRDDILGRLNSIGDRRIDCEDARTRCPPV
jgi:K+-sensing histidine kinase KdpD